MDYLRYLLYQSNNNLSIIPLSVIKCKDNKINLCEGHPSFIPLPTGFKTNLKQEFPIELISFPMEKEEFFIKVAYYYYYLKYIHFLITNNIITYEWHKISDFTNNNFIDNSNGSIILKNESAFYENLKYYRNNNQYVINFHKNNKSLGEDIQKKGMYCCFIGNYEKNNEYNLVHGFHRLYSLSLFPDNNKEYLFLNLPQTYNISTIGLSSMKVPCFNSIIEYNPLLKSFLVQKQDERDYLIQNFLRFCDNFAKYLHKYSSSIEVNKILNNKILFEEFLKYPFKENEYLEGKKKYE